MMGKRRGKGREGEKERKTAAKSKFFFLLRKKGGNYQSI